MNGGAGVGNNHHRASMVSLPSSGSRGAGGGGSASRLRRPSISLLSTADELPDAQAVLARAHSSGAARGSTATTAAGATNNAISRSSVISPTPDLTSGTSSSLAPAGPVSSALQNSDNGGGNGGGGGMMTPNNPPQFFARPNAFISYSRKDISFVRLLYQHFENAGRNVWIGLTTMHFAARTRMSLHAAEAQFLCAWLLSCCLSPLMISCLSPLCCLAQILRTFPAPSISWSLSVRASVSVLHSST
jgi:hypothetical protein